MIFLFMPGILGLLIVLLAFLLPLAALIDILRSNFEGNNKLIWVLVVIFFSFFGSILYFVIGREQKKGGPIR